MRAPRRVAGGGRRERHAVQKGSAYGQRALGAGDGVHAPAVQRAREARRPSRRGASGPRHRAWHKLPRHRLPLSRQRGLRGRGARAARRARRGLPRDQAAPWLVPRSGRSRPDLLRAAEAPAHRSHRLLPHPQRDQPRSMGAPARPGHRGLDRAAEARWAYRRDGVLLPWQRRRLRARARRVRLGFLPDPVQLRRRDLSGGHGRPEGGGGARARRDGDGAAAGRPAGGQAAAGGTARARSRRG